MTRARAGGIRSLGGRKTSSKSVAILSDLHVGSKFSLASSLGPIRLSKDQLKLKEHWDYCVDSIGKVDLLLCNGDMIDGDNRKQNGYQLWSADQNEQVDDVIRLLKQWHYQKLLITKGSNYHVQIGQTSFEETLGARLNSLQYSQMFSDVYYDNETVREGGKRHTNYYVFFDVLGKLFNATHHVGFSKWQAYRVGAIARELSDLQGFAGGKYYDINRNIDVIIRSHVHYFVYYEDPDGIAFTSPAFKFPDQHLYRSGMGGTYPSIGAVKVIVEPNGEIDVKKFLMPKNKMPKPEVLQI